MYLGESYDIRKNVKQCLLLETTSKRKRMSGSGVRMSEHPLLNSSHPASSIASVLASPVFHQVFILTIVPPILGKTPKITNPTEQARWPWPLISSVFSKPGFS